MEWLTDLQASIRGPVFAFLAASWQYLVLATIFAGWALLYQGARRQRADSGADAGDVSFDTADGAGGDGGD